MRIRHLFSEMPIQKIVPRALAERAEDLAYLRRISAWQRENAHLDHGHDRPDPEVPFRFRQFERVLNKENLAEGPICYLEFGVAEGRSFRWWSGHNTHPDSQFIGFDTFTGLPEDWGAAMPQGTFDTGGESPFVSDERCAFEKGLFQRTLPEFLSRNPRRAGKLVAHLDADLYGSTLFVLTMLWPLLEAGDVIILGDFCSIRQPTHVFRAFRDFTQAYPFAFEGIDSTYFGHQFVIKVKSTDPS